MGNQEKRDDIGINKIKQEEQGRHWRNGEKQEEIGRNQKKQE